MSGIAGIVGRIDDDNRAALARMSAALARRGPDGEGTWTSPPDVHGRGCLLAHRRLGSGQKQPIVDRAHQQVLALDGTIVNHPELRDQLIAGGHEIEDSGDAVIVLRHFISDGIPALSRFRGMYALALWDEADHRLLLARDPIGHKSLYVCRTISRDGEGALLFASQLRAILASGLLPRTKLNPAAVASVLWNGFVMGPQTMVQGVELLWPGQARTFDSHGHEVSSETFWQMPAPAQSSGDDGSSIQQALNDAVRMNMRSHAPVCVFLSGGVDSSSIANLAQQHSTDPIDTFCLSFDDPSLSEGSAAEEIAKAIGSNHHEVRLTEQQFVQTLDEAIDSLDQPTFDALNQYHICRGVREAGKVVALGGIGGDAIFGGDITLRRLPRLQRFAACSSWLPTEARVAAAKLVASFAQRSSGPIGAQTRWAKLPDIARAGEDLMALYQLNYALFLPDFQRELLINRALCNGHTFGMSDPMQQWLGRQMSSHSPMSAVAILETRCYIGQRLLRDADSVSGALSMQLRSPLCDPHLIEQLNRISEARKYLPVGYKPLLRKYGLAGLDPRLFDRPKSGFVLPFDRWIRRNLGAVMENVFRDERACAAVGLNGDAVARLWQAFQQNAPGLYWTRPWAVYVLLRWCHRHGVLS